MILMGTMSPRLSANKANSAIKIWAELIEISDTNAKIRFYIKNDSDSEIVIEKYAAPWGIRSSVLLVLASENGLFSPEKQDLVIDDPCDGYVNITAGDTAFGDVLLAGRFERFRDMHSRDNAILFWMYDRASSEGDRRYFGGLSLPKGGRPKDHKDHKDQAKDVTS